MSSSAPSTALPRAGQSIILHEGPFPLKPGSRGGSADGDRHPVVAAGSNRSPEQLGRKFDGTGLGDIPVSLAELEGSDCVYSAHVAAYGAMPATLRECPGVRVFTAVTWLDDEQLNRMHETESLGRDYAFEIFTPVNLITRHGLKIDKAHRYRSLHGPFVPEDRPIALADVRAEGRVWPAWTQWRALSHVHRRLKRQRTWKRLSTSWSGNVFRSDATTELSDKPTTIINGANNHAANHNQPVGLDLNNRAAGSSISSAGTTRCAVPAHMAAAPSVERSMARSSVKMVEP